MGLRSEDDYQAPWLAFWYRGIGRAVALTIEVDGKYSGQFANWEDYEDFLITPSRWILGGEENQNFFVDVQQSGQTAVVRLELDPEQSQEFKAPMLSVIIPGIEREDLVNKPFEWTGANTLEARFTMDREGTYRPLIRLGPNQNVRGPVLTLPYSPEFAPRRGLPSGPQLLNEMASLTGGVERIDPLTIFESPPHAIRYRSLATLLLTAAIALLLLEIAGRRFSLWERYSEPPQPVRKTQSKLIPPRPLQPVSVRSPHRGAPVPVANQEPDPKTNPNQQPKPIDIFSQAKQRAKKRT